MHRPLISQWSAWFNIAFMAALEEKRTSWGFGNFDILVGLVLFAVISRFSGTVGNVPYIAVIKAHQQVMSGMG